MEFGVGDTWNEVLDELLHTGTHSPSLPGKTDVVELSLAAKNSITVFHPHMDEAIEVAQNLDNTLKYATFKVIKSTTTTESESNPTSTSKRNAFSVLMSSATELSKFAKHKDATGQKFTGDALQGMVFVKLQLACNTHIEFAYYATGFATRKDVCCHCAVDGVQRDANLLKQYRVVLPVCADCLLAGKDSVKRNPIKN
ncbi:uncharacterized protein LOC117329392 [Pecten maximus]|nr:uncharacterized protein LOC117329392 [Pecten maximus]